ncbi:MAG: tetratricopeptide repeat protein [Planctomycetes bacterium]|nr:tetratricopeptide repeat protein [Planctomycetota bacterium]
MDAWRAAGSFRRARALELANPQDAGARFQLALTYAQAGRWRKAAPLARAAVRITRENPIAPAVPAAYLRLLGQVCLVERRPAEALAAFDEAAGSANDLGLPDALFGRAQALEALGRVAEAEAGYRAALGANSSLLPAYWRLAVLARRRGDAVAAEAVRAEFTNTVAHLARRSRAAPAVWVWRFRFMALLAPLGPAAKAV